ncbi:MAG TPA: hypothetical protein VFZ26_01935 [Gemmatimonadales bacterium]
MVRDADMPREDGAVAHPHAAGHPDTRHQQTALPDPDVVADLHQVVQFGSPADHSVVYTPAVHAGVGADLDLVLQDAPADVGDPPVSFPIGKIPEAVTADDGAGLEHDPAAEPAAGVADHPGADDGVIADDHTVAQRGELADPAAGAQPHAASQHGERPDGDLRAEQTSGAEPGGGVHAGRVLCRREEALDHPHQRPIRIGDDDAGASAGRCLGQALGNEDDAGAALPEFRGIAGRHHERDRIGAAPVERPHPVNRHAPIAKQAATDEVGDRLRGESRRGHVLSCPTGAAG